MSRLTRWIAPALLVMALAASLTTPALAQGDITAEEQAALDAAYQAMAGFLAYDTYSMTVIQDLDQTIAFTAAASAFEMVQQVHSEGSLDFQRAPGQPYDNRTLDLTQTITQDIRSGDQSQVTDIGPNRTRMIAVDGRIYLRLDVQPDLAAFMPQGWQDVTEGANMFPGMETIDLDAMLTTGQALSFGYLDQFFGNVIAVEVMDPDPAMTGAAQRYLLTLDPARLLEAIGTETLAGMFAAGLGETLDVVAFIEAMFTDPDTQYQLDVTLDADGALIAYGERIISDSDVSAAMAASLGQGATVTLAQDITQTYRITGVDQPLTITAPDLDAE